MNSWNDPRARELKRLQLALATFALQLDAFELRTDSVLRAFGRPRDNGPVASFGSRLGEARPGGPRFGEGGEIARQ